MNSWITRRKDILGFSNDNVTSNEDLLGEGLASHTVYS